MTGQQAYNLWCKFHNAACITNPALRPWDRLMEPERVAWERLALAFQG